MLAIISTSSLILPVTLTPSSIESFTVGTTNSIPVLNVIDSSGVSYHAQPEVPVGVLTSSGTYSLEVVGTSVIITDVGAVNPAPGTFASPPLVVSGVNTNPLTTPVNTQSILGGAVVSASNPIPTVAQGTTMVVQATQAASLINGSATAAGVTTIGTPAANSNLHMLHIEIPGNAIQATAGQDAITVALNGVTIAVLDPYVPAVSLGTGILYQTTINFSTVAFGTGSAGTLTVSLTNALTGGQVNVNAYFD
jgi:hypothetical protein